MSEALARLCHDPFTAQLLVLIAERPGINTTQLAAQLKQTHSRVRRHLAQLRQAGLLTARIPENSNQSYGWTLAGYQVPPVEPEPEPEPEPIAAMPEPEPIATMPELAPEPVVEHHNDAAGGHRTMRHSATLPTGLTEEDMQWHRYWHSRAVQRSHRLAELENT